MKKPSRRGPALETGDSHASMFQGSAGTVRATIVEAMRAVEPWIERHVPVVRDRLTTNLRGKHDSAYRCLSNCARTHVLGGMTPKHKKPHQARPTTRCVSRQT